MSILLVKKTPVELTADSKLDLFVPLLTLEGSNQREMEEAVMVFWANFLKVCIVFHIYWNHCCSVYL